MAKLLYQGHGSFRICTDSGRVIYIDPYVGEGYDLPADLILISHQHYDHNNLKLITANDGCQVFSNEQAIKDGVYQTLKLDYVEVEAVQAYNKNHKKDKCVGFIVVVDRKKLYFSGDTSTTEQMSTMPSRQIDYAILCCDGIFNMGLEEAAHCADLIKAKYVIPAHIKPGKLFDVKKAEKLNVSNKLIVKPAEEITL